MHMLPLKDCCCRPRLLPPWLQSVVLPQSVACTASLFSLPCVPPQLPLDQSNPRASTPAAAASTPQPLAPLPHACHAAVDIAAQVPPPPPQLPGLLPALVAGATDGARRRRKPPFNAAASRTQQQPQRQTAGGSGKQRHHNQQSLACNYHCLLLAFTRHCCHLHMPLLTRSIYPPAGQPTALSSTLGPSSTASSLACH